MVAALVAGPAIRNANAAPGEAPMCMKPAAIGTDAVAHTYTGTPAANKNQNRQHAAADTRCLVLW